ncbi:type II secretion system secretin GspD [Acidocella aminolytica]|jgi:general secretion pathway protein D|uniref:General secretion pathway protein D n=1 Tax=Acidocella aminolytica 101 = DSM 11237 TaxID=1120923 RepID=A0A0D6PDG6_9PROT|nr:type II secretion system secretin GspD [Acidocella aminolytica]GAN79401.1 general secretion pathway protein D [Acidocella aminolytica 101 = DSM 11237]GBQ39296.1 general secretion pathway protein D [Acidocella aminolytica 101 = DSM 11237]SHE40281.1 general secretion pathway protein D [Acidocella aminolytica 101 = DSM 11237]
MRKTQLPCLFGLLVLASCHSAPPPVALTGAPLTPAPLSAKGSTSSAPRVSGPVAGQSAPPSPAASYGALATGTSTNPGTAQTNGQGNISFNFADTDIRTVVAEILGNILHVNYTIDPGVSGTVTLHTVTPLTLNQVLPTLQTLLAQNNAVLVHTDGLYRVMPASDSGGAAAQTQVIHLRYASATQLAAVLQPYVAKGGKLAADPNSNAIVIQGDPETRAALAGLVSAFDVDALAGQSYELFPVSSGDAKEFASAFTTALGKQAGSKGAAAVSVVPLDRISAVLVIAKSNNYLNDAARIYAVINKVQMETVRSWHVFYLRNSRANDAAYLLQQAFTPDNVTAQPTAAAKQTVSDMMGNNSNTTPPTSTSSAESSSTSISGGTGGGSESSPPNSANTGSASALLGPLTSNSTSTNTDQMRIIPDTQNNAVMVYATAQEDDQIAGMLSKIDIQPLQVQIDATIAEVDLTGQLQYGTQFFFKSGGINAVLSESTTSALSTSFPGFVLSGHGSDAAPLALSALEAVTKVRVLSSPELMVLDGQTASLKVGDSVPYLTQTSQSTVTSTSDVIQSINYRDTGVIMKVTPHIGGDGLVTMDISQEVSGVSPTLTTTGIDSPTFTERTVTSRVAIQDGQTIGLAGLISDNDSNKNEGLPWIKNVPVLGALFGTQTNKRVREELLVLITPHVVRNQQQALDLTQDMEQQLPNAALVPGALQSQPFTGSADPNQKVRADLTK